MSANTFLLEALLRINGILLLAFLLFRGYRLLAAKLGRSASSASLLRHAQALLVASILIPAVFSAIPERSFPRLSFSAPEISADSASPRRIAKRGAIAASAKIVKLAPPQSRASLESWVRFAARKVFSEAGYGWVLGLLALGFLVRLIRLGFSLRLLLAVLSQGVELRRIGRVSVVATTAIASPFSTRMAGRAHVAVPLALLGERRNLKIAIQHELQHHRQRDTAWALFMELLVCLFYANPAIFLWKKEITELQEFSCDEALIGQRGVSAQEYGSCLIRVAEAALGSRLMLVGTASMAGPRNPRHFKSFLRRRIEMFQQYERSRRKKSVGILIGTLTMLATATFAYGAQQAFRSSPPVEPNPGQAVFEPQVQKIASEVVRDAVQRFSAKAGFVLVSEPRTGKLLAVANYSRDKSRDAKAWALSYRMEPASVMKGLVASTAIDQGLTTLDETFDCGNGEYVYGHNLFRDWRPFHRLSTTDTVVNSSNICGIKIGERLGSGQLARMLSEFGFGPGGTTDGFPEALAGNIPRPSQLTEEEYVGLVSVGYTLQGTMHITPLEMVQAYGAIANEGQLMKAISSAEPDSSAAVVRRVLSPQTSQGMKGVLRKVVLEGTGRPARSRLYSTAGKTATAYTPGDPDHDTLGGERAVASFVGFAPVNDPKVAIYVGIIDPTNSADHKPHGSEHAAPVFREVAERVLQYLHVAPDLK